MTKKRVIVKVRLGVRSMHLTKKVCDHLLGEEHTLGHRMTVGSGFIVVGVLIASAGSGVVHLFLEGVGFLIHGIGTVPFVEKAVHIIAQQNKEPCDEKIEEEEEISDEVEA